MIKDIIIKENIHLIGKVDDRAVPFHRLTLTKGTTYNSYFINAKKPTIIDTVDFAFGKEYVDYLRDKINLNAIQYIVINHTEPDHSGALGALVARAKNAVIVCTQPAVYELKEMYKLHNREFLVIKDGDRLDLGDKTLHFIQTPYLHTEETMVTYCEEDKILFPCDIFSTHVANEEYFNDLAKTDITEDFIGYYQLIMHPHRKYVQEMIGKIRSLDIEMIAPSHGFVIRQDVEKFLSIYDERSRNTHTAKSALILYSTMTGNTKKIAQLLEESMKENGINTKVLDVNKVKEAEVLEEVKRADALFVGTSTKYADMIGNLEKVLKLIAEKDLSKKIGAAFGSYGWSGEAVEIVQNYLLGTDLEVPTTSSVIQSTGMTDIHFPIRVRFSPQEKDEEEIKRVGDYIAEKLLETE